MDGSTTMASSPSKPKLIQPPVHVKLFPNASLHIQILIILQAAALDRSLGHFKIHSFCQHSLE